MLACISSYAYSCSIHPCGRHLRSSTARVWIVWMRPATMHAGISAGRQFCCLLIDLRYRPVYHQTCTTRVCHSTLSNRKWTTQLFRQRWTSSDAAETFLRCWRVKTYLLTVTVTDIARRPRHVHTLPHVLFSVPHTRALRRSPLVLWISLYVAYIAG